MIPENPNILRLLSPNEITLRIESLKLDAFMRAFAPGETVTGRVLENLGGNKSLLDFNGRQVLAESNSSLKPGQNITAQVENQNSRPVLRLISDKTESRPSVEFGRKIPTSDSPSRPIQDTVQFQNRTPVETPPNRVLAREFSSAGIKPSQPAAAEVIDIRQPQSVTVRVGSAEFDVKVPDSSTFRPGEKVDVMFRPAGNAFSLEILDARDAARATLIKLVSAVHAEGVQRQPLGRLIQELQPILQQVLNTDPEIQSGELRLVLDKLVKEIPEALLKKISESALQKAVEGSGIRFESHLRTLVEGQPGTQRLETPVVESNFKARLFSLEKLLTGIPPETVKESSPVHSLLQQVRQTLQNVELQQLSHVAARQENTPLLLQIPSQMEGMGDTIKLFVRRDGQDGDSGKSSNEAYTLVFFLDMSQLGPIRVDVTAQGKQLAIRLTLESQEILEYLEGHFEGLETFLASVGYSAKIEGQVEQNEASNVPDELVSLMVDLPRNLVDLTT